MDRGTALMVLLVVGAVLLLVARFLNKQAQIVETCAKLGRPCDDSRRGREHKSDDLLSNFAGRLGV